MRKIIGGFFQSLDGVMQAPGGPTEDPTGGFKYGGWLPPITDEQVGNAVGSFFSGSYDLLLGRRTYDIFAAHWGFLADSDPMGKAFTDCNKYVLTRGQQPLTWKNSHRMTTMDDVKKVKTSEGSNIIIQGSTSIYSDLFAAGLVDELFVMTFPIVLGKGKKLFSEVTPPFSMKMLKGEVTKGGSIVSHYKIGGDVKTGTFLLDNPGPDELKRREKMKQGTW